MDVTVSTPDKHLARVAAAYQMDASAELAAVLDTGTNAQKKAALGKFFLDRWTGEVKGRVVSVEAGIAATAADVAARATLGDNPLAP